MSVLSVLAFPQEQTANQVLATVEQLQKQNLIQVDDAAVVTISPDGKPKIKQANSLVGMGALGGAFWGLLFGMLFFMPLIGAAIGAGAGALGGKMADYGIDDDFIRQVSSQLKPGQSALFMMTSNVVVDRVVDALKPYHPKMLYTSLPKEQEAKLRELVGAAA